MRSAAVPTPHGGGKPRAGRAAALALALSAFLCAAGRAATYHVSPGGSDEAAGTASAPFRSVQKAADVMEPGDTCLVHAGIYRETVRPARSGREGSPLRFQAAPGERAVITGADAVTGWARHEKHIYKAPADWPVSQVFVGGRLMVPARLPNMAPDADPFEPPLLDLVAEEGRLRGKALDQPADFWKGGVVWGIDERLGWVAETRPILGSEPGAVRVDTAKGWWKAGPGRAYLAGVLAALDAPGEWHQEEATLYLRPPEGADPAALAVEARRRRFGFDLAGLAHVEVRGLELFAASINLDAAERCVVEGVTVEHAAFERMLRGGFNRDRGINASSEGLGIVLGGSHNVLRNCRVAFSLGDGISIFGSDNTVENCVVGGCNTSASDCAPINCTGEGHVIRRSTLYGAGRSILVHRKLRRGRIEHNHMYNGGLMANDCGLTYAYQTDGEGTVIAYNRVHHNFGRGWGCVGIYLDDMCSRHVVHHNLVYEVSEAIALNPPKSQNNLIYNNTFDGRRVGLGMSTRRPQDMAGSAIRNNIFTRAVAACPGAAVENNLLPGTDPRFVDAARGDYRLQDASPAVDAGVLLPPYTDGHAGRAPDLGAFEHGQPPWTAGSDLGGGG